MIRSVQLNINYSNTFKLTQLNVFCEEAQQVINKYIDELWKIEDFSSTFVKIKVETWLSARMQQCLGKQALEIVKSQRQKEKKTKPKFNRKTFNLDSRFVKIEQDVNSFDIWVTLTCLGNKLKLILPSKKHKQFNKFITWTLKKSIRLRCNGTKHYIDVYFEKEAPVKKEKGKVVGLDSGYKKLLASSEGETYGEGLEELYKKISRKKQGSKGFKRALKERDNKVNGIVKQFPIDQYKEIVVEDLKNVKKKTKGKLRKQFINKLQRWTYPNVLNRLSYRAEEQGIIFKKVPPAYTSQKCSKCGVVCKENRKGETYKCACGLEMDADINASINILHLGVYSP